MATLGPILPRKAGSLPATVSTSQGRLVMPLAMPNPRAPLPPPPSPVAASGAPPVWDRPLVDVVQEWVRVILGRLKAVPALLGGAWSRVGGALGGAVSGVVPVGAPRTAVVALAACVFLGWAVSSLASMVSYAAAAALLVLAVLAAAKR